MLELGRMSRIATDGGVITEHKLIVGIPEDSILKIAEETEADLIAMGTHGRTGWDRLQLGSTAEAVLRNAHCPVLTVHAAIVADSPLNPRRIKLSRILVVMDFSPPPRRPSGLRRWLQNGSTHESFWSMLSNHRLPPSLRAASSVNPRTPRHRSYAPAGFRNCPRQPP